MENVKEELLESWIHLNNCIKNERIAIDLTYNETTILHLVWKYCQKNNNEGVAFKQLLQDTKMLKSLANRTIDSLSKKSFIEKFKKDNDNKRLYIKLLPDGINFYIKTHQYYINLVDELIKLIGEDDAKALIRISNKIKSNMEIFDLKEYKNENNN